MAKKHPQKTNRFLSGLSGFLATYWPVLLVILFGVAVVIHISISPGWRGVYLYSGDSTTLAAFVKSIQYGEQQRWIFSSQIFFFPETLLYAISFLFTQSIYASLVFNSILNIVIVYFLFNWIGGQIFDSKLKSQLLSILAIALICVYALLELHPTVNTSATITLFFFTTYYYGIVLSSLALLSLTLCVFRSTSQKNKLIYAAIMTSITALTAASNPLLMLQFTLPYLITILFLFFINRMQTKITILLIGIQIAGLILAQIIRTPFKDMIGSSPNSYININNLPKALDQLGQTIAIIRASKASTIEYSVMIGVILFATCYVLWVLYRGFRGLVATHRNDYVLFSMLFGAISPGVIILATLLTGNSYTRYFLPISFFSLVAIFAIISQIRLSTRLLKLSVTGAAGIFIIYCLLALPHSQSLFSAIPSDNIECFDRSIGNTTVNAIGSYWSSRPLDLYSNPRKVRVIQATPALTPMAWLNDRADYSNRTYDTIIVEKQATAESSIGIPQVGALGTPSHIWTCNDFYIYHYNPGSQGYILLNQLMHTRY